MDTNSRNLVRGERVFGKAITYHAWWWRNRFLPHAILDKIVAALQVEAQYRLDKVYDIFLKPLPWWFETEGCWCYYYYSSSQGDQLCAWENTGDQPLDLAILLCFFSFFFGECPSPFWYWWWSEASLNLIFTLSLLLWKLACYKIEIEKHTKITEFFSKHWSWLWGFGLPKYISEGVSGEEIPILVQYVVLFPMKIWCHC